MNRFFQPLTFWVNSFQLLQLFSPPALYCHKEFQRGQGKLFFSVETEQTSQTVKVQGGGRSRKKKKKKITENDWGFMSQQPPKQTQVLMAGTCATHHLSHTKFTQDSLFRNIQLYLDPSCRSPSLTSSPSEGTFGPGQEPEEEVKTTHLRIWSDWTPKKNEIQVKTVKQKNKYLFCYFFNVHKPESDQRNHSFCCA